MKTLFASWPMWAFLSAVFAAITAILAKVGVQGVNSNCALFVRTIVVILFLIAILATTGQFQALSSITRRSQVFLVLSGFATGVSWVCYFRALKLGPVSQVAPVDKLSLLLVAILGVAFLGEKLSIRNWLGVVLMAVGAVLVAIKR
ncbi:MAG: EamA family transporter [Lentisphaerae bacterium]|nr:EamA family transporter [Lentisphaerota bacterium]